MTIFVSANVAVTAAVPELIVRHEVMEAPEHIWRCPTKEAIDKLAARFGLPNYPGMQDWEYEVADPERVDEFLAAYETEGLSDDEKFTLMETIVECFEQIARAGGDLASDPRWQRTLGALDSRIGLHAYTLWYWSCLEAEAEEDAFHVAPVIRTILAAHREYFAEPGGAANRSQPVGPEANRSSPAAGSGG